MKPDSITFEVIDQKVYVHGYPELEGREGYMMTDAIAFFRGKGWNNHEWYIANIQTGRIRLMATPTGQVMVDDNEIDYAAIDQQCEYGSHNAANKVLCYGSMYTWDGFKDGLCAISWTLYPDGQYFADSDGYGMRDNDEERVYAIINEKLDVVVPFRPVKDIEALLSELRTHT